MHFSVHFLYFIGGNRLLFRWLPFFEPLFTMTSEFKGVLAIAISKIEFGFGLYCGISCTEFLNQLFYLTDKKALFSVNLANLFSLFSWLVRLLIASATFCGKFIYLFFSVSVLDFSLFFKD